MTETDVCTIDSMLIKDWCMEGCISQNFVIIKTKKRTGILNQSVIIKAKNRNTLLKERRNYVVYNYVAGHDCSEWNDCIIIMKYI